MAFNILLQFETLFLGVYFRAYETRDLIFPSNYSVFAFRCINFSNSPYAASSFLHLGKLVNNTIRVLTRN